jgi:hypothetical protein
LRAAVAETEGQLMRGGLYLFGAEPDAAALPFAQLVTDVASLVHEATEQGR